jgi:hypothetical protein
MKKPSDDNIGDIFIKKVPGAESKLERFLNEMISQHVLETKLADLCNSYLLNPTVLFYDKGFVCIEETVVNLQSHDACKKMMRRLNNIKIKGLDSRAVIIGYGIIKNDIVRFRVYELSSVESGRYRIPEIIYMHLITQGGTLTTCLQCATGKDEVEIIILNQWNNTKFRFSVEEKL